MTDGANEASIEVGELVKRALKASGMSARQAALSMDISDTRLRHIINGYQPVGRGQRIDVHAPGDTLARIADALNITPEELEQVGRPDAAHELRLRLTAWDREDGNFSSLQQSIQEWAEDPLIYIPPAEMLRLFEDAALFGELERRMENLRAHLRGDARSGYMDVGGGTMPRKPMTGGEEDVDIEKPTNRAEALGEIDANVARQVRREAAAGQVEPVEPVERHESGAG